VAAAWASCSRPRCWRCPTEQAACAIVNAAVWQPRGRCLVAQTTPLVRRLPPPLRSGLLLAGTETGRFRRDDERHGGHAAAHTASGGRLGAAAARSEPERVQVAVVVAALKRRITAEPTVASRVPSLRGQRHWRAKAPGRSALARLGGFRTATSRSSPPPSPYLGQSLRPGESGSPR
jgi:hypothetical protein